MKLASAPVASPGIDLQQLPCGECGIFFLKIRVRKLSPQARGHQGGCFFLERIDLYERTYFDKK
jgi:hypothetical protein